MKKTISMLCVVLVVGFAGTAFAGKKEKVDVCHNGSVYDGEVVEGAVYDEDAWVDGSFVINISENALHKHLENHGDSEEIILGEPVITEVMYDEVGNITGYESQPSCVIVEPAE